MARVNTYLNFPGNAEEALTFYKDTFGTNFVGPLVRFADMGVPVGEGEDQMIMHAEVEITAGHVLMATDITPSQPMECRVGNNTTISLELDSTEEVDRLYRALSIDSTEGQAPAQMPWGQYWGTCLDRFGIRWMFAHGDVVA